MMKMHYRKKIFFSNVQHFDKIFLVAAYGTKTETFDSKKSFSLSNVQSWAIERSLSFKKTYTI